MQLNTLRHGNLALFYGACVDPPNACILWEYCAKGSVRVGSLGVPVNVYSLLVVSGSVGCCAKGSVRVGSLGVPVNVYSLLVVSGSVGCCATGSVRVG